MGSQEDCHRSRAATQASMPAGTGYQSHPESQATVGGHTTQASMPTGTSYQSHPEAQTTAGRQAPIMELAAGYKAGTTTSESTLIGERELADWQMERLEEEFGRSMIENRKSNKAAQKLTLRAAADEVLKMSQGVRSLRSEGRCYAVTANRHDSLSLELAARSFLPFTPALLHYWLREVDGADFDSPAVRDFCMALLLIDVSGFTNMSAKLGAELTRKHTSAFFDQIIHCIRHYGGDVLKFLGDALLVAWPALCPASEETRQRIATNAAACAAEIMRTLNGYRISEEILLTLHGSISIGDVYAFDVGNHDRREFLIGGNILAEIGDMEAEATSGQLIINKAFATLLPAETGFIHLESGNVRMDLDTIPRAEGPVTGMVSEHLALQYNDRRDDSVTSFLSTYASYLETHVPYACREFVHRSMLDVVGEMRHVTTLFMALDALVPHLNRGDAALVQEFFVVIIEAVRGTGGVVRQFVLDDKGCIVICAWGLPHAAYGNGQDAERAIQCACQILATLHSGLKLTDFESEMAGPRIGIAAGEAYVGLIGASHRCEYAMIGPSVNLAARLMGKARPWQVLVEGIVRDNALEADSSWHFISHAPVVAKGYDQTIPIFEPESDHKLLFSKSFIGDFTEMWNKLDPQVQMVGKVASVLASVPAGQTNDFPLRALVDVVERLAIATRKQAKDAMVQLQTIRILRLTRGARRGNPSFAFANDSCHKFVMGLLTIEYTVRVHDLFAQWLETKMADAEENTDPDPVVQKAKMALLHKEVDAKLQHHRTSSRTRPCFLPRIRREIGAFAFPWTCRFSSLADEAWEKGIAALSGLGHVARQVHQRQDDPSSSGDRRA